jgi:hypothetical protein
MTSGTCRVLCALSTFVPLLATPPEKKPVPPNIMLWSWYAPDDFRFVSGPDIGIAYLALSIQLEGRDEATPAPRAQPVRIPPQTWQTAVIRIDFDSYGSRRPGFTELQRKLVLQMIAEIAKLSHAQGIQIDFDAPPSAYAFYRHLLTDVRARLGPKVFLSMTALVSWCTVERSWLSGLLVDEIVPMAFYMGQSTPAITMLLQRGGQFSFPACRSSIGVEIGGYDDPIRPHPAERAYFFSQKAWTVDSVRAARQAIQP